MIATVIFIVGSVALGMTAISIYLRKFCVAWRELKLLLWHCATSLEGAVSLYNAIEQTLAKDPSLERRLKSRIIVIIFDFYHN
jgi:hypothetical protein